ncbi:armadillo-type protein [Sporodiniella umbellata]|nr:armadillo-type protein [Sporodiniella umbellata]
MRHPDMLRYLDGVETEQSIMFVTDPVEPLSNQLNQDPNKNLITWGLYKIANAIKFLTSCDMVHGNVRIASIFTNKAGEWKLGGFELLCSMKEESPVILTFGGLVSDAQRYASPEVKKAGWTSIKELPEGSLDSYHLGCLIYETYNHRFETTDSLLNQKGSIPQKMLRIYTQLLNPNAKARASADMFIDEGLGPKGFFTTEFVNVSLFLENINIKEQHEKDTFFKNIDAYIESFPPQFCKYKILPELIKSFEYAAGGAKVLRTIVKVGDHLSDQEYETIIIEPVVRMFASPDRAIRISLLENLHKFIGHMTNKVVTEQVFPNIATGFTDVVPVIREQTIKSVLLVVPKLSERVINYELLKHIAKLQTDPEPGIRTNTVICLGKIAKNLSENTRKKILVAAFIRSMRDSFHHARVAALMALSATLDYYDAQECAFKAIPAISVALIDKEKPVRDQAFKTLNLFVKKTQEFAETMPETAIQVSTAVPTPEEAVAQTTSMNSVLGTATKGLAGWAVSSIQSRFSTPNGEIGNPVSASPNSNTPKMPSPQNSPSMPKLFDTQSIEPNIENSNGWDDEDSIPLELGDETESTTEIWDSPSPATRSAHNIVQSTHSFDLAQHSSKAEKAQGSMKLGLAKPKPKPKPQVVEEEGLDSMISTLNTKDDKQLELERRREERKQRMAELREKKKGGIGAKRVQNIGL